MMIIKKRNHLNNNDRDNMQDIVIVIHLLNEFFM